MEGKMLGAGGYHKIENLRPPDRGRGSARAAASFRVLEN